MADLGPNRIDQTYCSLLKTCDNNAIAGSKLIEDGTGNATALTLGAAGQSSSFDAQLTVSNGFVANSLTYPTSDGSANNVLKTDGSAGLTFACVNTLLPLSGTVLNGAGTTTARLSTQFTSISAIGLDQTGRINEVTLNSSNADRLKNGGSSSSSENGVTGLIEGKYYLVTWFGYSRNLGETTATSEGLQLTDAESGGSPSGTTLFKTQNTSINWTDGNAPMAGSAIVQATSTGEIYAFVDTRQAIRIQAFDLGY